MKFIALAVAAVFLTGCGMSSSSYQNGGSKQVYTLLVTKIYEIPYNEDVTYFDGVCRISKLTDGRVDTTTRDIRIGVTRALGGGLKIIGFAADSLTSGISDIRVGDVIYRINNDTTVATTQDLSLALRGLVPKKPISVYFTRNGGDSTFVRSIYFERVMRKRPKPQKES